MEAILAIETTMMPIPTAVTRNMVMVPPRLCHISVCGSCFSQLFTQCYAIGEWDYQRAVDWSAGVERGCKQTHVNSLPGCHQDHRVAEDGAEDGDEAKIAL
jgi:hypothetical protein